ncbi:MAG: hydroxymethylbilane synthase [Lachnospiraceae bacterium]|nr:hydroxymethylbilane synthase [Lachnospiraceae bacterium]
MKYRIGTRGSKLALVQAEYVCSRLARAYPEDVFEIQIIKTKGDLVLDKPLYEIGDKGVFVKEIEEKLLSGEIQIGVHSMKDMPALPAPGLMFAKAWKREDPRDVLILREKKSLWELPKGAVIGTGSRRREYQLKRLRPDLVITGIRGNIDTRLRKMEEERLDGIVLAAAGLHRLNMQEKITQYLETEEMIPAPAQGILALEISEGSEKLLHMLNAFSEEETVLAAEAERGFLQEMGGNCHTPVGAVLKKRPDGLCRLDAMFGDEKGIRQAYVSVSGNDPAELAQKAAFRIRQQIAGKVFLTGAGPGDPGLITVKGLQTIREADCIIYDRLAAPELLEEAKPGCEKIYAGKENHHHTLTQDEIHQLLLKKSMEYEKTVRLKGGDVYVFGRGGEEGVFLKKHGVPFEVVPGVSSCMAGLAYGGIPITHRGVSLGFHVVTAHDRRDQLSDIDFQAMAKGKETCVFLMGLRKVKEIADRLLEAGMPANTKTAVISHATMPEQQTCVADLEHIAEAVTQAELSSPALIVVGEVVSLREELNFFERRPLFGKHYLIPRIGEKHTRLGRLLEQQGACVDEVQVGKIQSKKRVFYVEEFEQVDWLVFTSKNGVESFFQSVKESDLDLRRLAGCKIAAIGEKTAELLKSYGIYADLIPDAFHSDALAEKLKEYLTGSECVWYLKAQNADSHLKEALEAFCNFEEIPIYENCAVAPDLDQVRSLGEYNGILFTCASSASRLTASLKENLDSCKKIYSIGPKTTSFLRKSGVEHISEAEYATYESLAACVVQED